MLNLFFWKLKYGTSHHLTQFCVWFYFCYPFFFILNKTNLKLKKKVWKKQLFWQILSLAPLTTSPKFVFIHFLFILNKTKNSKFWNFIFEKNKLKKKQFFWKKRLARLAAGVVIRRAFISVKTIFKGMGRVF